MSNFVIRYLDESDYELWDRFVDQSEYGSIFFKSYWLKNIYRLDPSVTLTLIGCFQKETLVGGMLIGSRKKFGLFRTVIPPYATCFYGVLFVERETGQSTRQENYRQAILEKMLGIIEENFHIISFSLPPVFSDIRPFIWRKYASRVLYTYRGSLRNSEEVLFDQFLPDLKRRIKKGEALHYTIDSEKSVESIDTAFALIEASFKKQNHPFRFNREDFQRFMNLPELDRHLKIHTIWWEEKPVATVVFIADNGVGYYWFAGADPNYLKTNLNQVLMWHGIKDLRSSGVTVLDMVGANTPTISYYKSAFNFQLTPYYRVTRETGGIARFLMGIKQFS
jgi:hypothetical protein